MEEEADPPHTLPDWEGIYGQQFIIFDSPFGDRNKEVVYLKTDPNTGKVVPDNLPEYLKTYWDDYSSAKEPDADHPFRTHGTDAHLYEVGSRPAYASDSEYPGMGICDIYYNRAADYPFFIRYHRQNVEQTGWETNYQFMNFTSPYDGNKMEIVKNGVLQATYDKSDSEEFIPNPEQAGAQVKWKDYLLGFNYSSCTPTNGILTTDS